MKLLNIDSIPGKKIEAISLVRGTVVYSKNFGKDFMAGIKGLVGGEIVGYTEMLNEARAYIYTGWWMIAFPAVFTMLSVLGFNLFGDGLRDLLDPLSGR